MAETIVCPLCKRKLKVDVEFLGQQVQCPSCAAPFRLDEEYIRPKKQIQTRPDPAPILDALPADQPPLLRKSNTRSLVVALVLGLVGTPVLMVVGVGVAVWVSLPQPQPRAAIVQDGGRWREAREALAGPVVPIPAEQIEQLKPLFQGLGDALTRQDHETSLAHFDVERMFDELVALGVFPRRLFPNQQATLRNFRAGMGRSFVRKDQNLGWKETKIRNVKPLPGGEVVVIARHIAPDNELKMRWWLTRQSGRWAIYDMEDLHTKIRTTLLVASVVPGDQNQLGELQRFLQGVLVIKKALDDDDPDKAERQFASIAEIILPSRLDALRLVIRGMIQLHRGQWKEALESVDRATSLQPDMPICDLLRGTAHNNLGQWEQGHKSLEAYRSLLGDDWVVCSQLGLSLRGLRRFDEAARAYRKALDQKPNELQAFIGMLNSLCADAPRDDISARFAKLENPEDAFLACALNCVDSKDARGIEQMVEALPKLDRPFAPADYYLALSRTWVNRANEAVPLFRAALKHQGDPAVRKDYVQGFLRAMADANQAELAYPAAPDPAEAFRLLANRLKETHRSNQLRKLLAAHAKVQPNDVLLPFYRGEVFVLEGRYSLAEKAFAAGLALRPSRETLDSFRASRVLARYYMGNPQSAYKEIGPRQDTFAQLAALHCENEDHAGLQALLDMHAQTAPNDSELLRYRYRLRIKQGKTAEGVSQFQEILARETSEEKRALLLSEFDAEMIEAGKVIEAYRASPDPLKAFERLAGKWTDDEMIVDSLRSLVAAHRARHADDPWVLFYSAELHIGEKAWDRACAELEKWYQVASKQDRDRRRWQYVRALYQTGRGLRAYAEVEPRQETFQQLANLLRNDKKGAELERLVAAERLRQGEGALLLIHEAEAKALQHQYARARYLLQKACLLYPREFMARGYWISSRDFFPKETPALVVYRGAIDKERAFEMLASELLLQKKTKDLVELLEEHGREYPNDPDHDFYAGELYLLRGDLPQAERRFIRARGRGSKYNTWKIDRSLSRARIMAGKAVAVYKEAGGGVEILDQLAWACQSEKDVAQLESLIEVHRRLDPEDGRLLNWDLEVRWLKKDYNEVLKLLTENRIDLLASRHHRWKSVDYLVRGLVRLKRSKEAVREAETYARHRSGDLLLLLLAHAADGNVEQAIKTMSRERPQRYLLARAYADEDLAPILKSAAFASFRDKFPEPMEKKTESPLD
jgi:tetratricopeptide (TPR) repeat protein